MKRFVAAALLFGACAMAYAQPSGHPIELSADGDGSAQLTLHHDGVGGVLRVQATFESHTPVKDSTEAHAKSRGFVGELRIDGKPCSEARGRVVARDGQADGRASTSCSIGTNGDKSVTVEAVVVKSDDVDRDDVKVTLHVDKIAF